MATVTSFYRCFFASGLLLLFVFDGALAAKQFDRTILPIKQPAPATSNGLDVRDTSPPPRFEVKAPQDAPNVLVVLVDDLGFGGTSPRAERPLAC